MILPRIVLEVIGIYTLSACAKWVLFLLILSYNTKIVIAGM